MALRTPRRSQEEGIKEKELWLEIKREEEPSNVKAVYYRLLLSVWGPGRSQSHYSETSKTARWMETSFTQMQRIWKLPDLLCQQCFHSESRRMRNVVAAGNLVWELPGEGENKNVLPRKGNTGNSGCAHTGLEGRFYEI